MSDCPREWYRYYLDPILNKHFVARARSPAREVDAGAGRQSTIMDAQAGASKNVDAQAGKAEDKELRAPDPTVDSPIGRGSQRPPLSLQSSALLSSASPSTAVLPSASAFTEAEVNLLASKKIYRSPDSGEWFHREENPDGRTMITSGSHARRRRILKKSARCKD